jgi:hypothetical protein
VPAKAYAVRRPQRGPPKQAVRCSLFYGVFAFNHDTICPSGAKFARCAFAVLPIESDSPLGMPLSRIDSKPQVRGNVPVASQLWPGKQMTAGADHASSEVGGTAVDSTSFLKTNCVSGLRRPHYKLLGVLGQCLYI